jgi:hypothetical protein
MKRHTHKSRCRDRRPGVDVTVNKVLNPQPTGTPPPPTSVLDLLDRVRGRDTSPVFLIAIVISIGFFLAGVVAVVYVMTAGCVAVLNNPKGRLEVLIALIVLGAAVINSPKMVVTLWRWWRRRRRRSP